MKNINIKGTIVSNDDKDIYDWIGWESTSPSDIAVMLEDANGEDVTFVVNSLGGDVFAGNEINYLISQYSGHTQADIVGAAASIATIICCGAEVVRMAAGAQYMIHNVSSSARGDYHDMDKCSEVLKNANKTIANTYQLKTGMSEEDLLALMDRETWMDAKKAKEYGFVDEIIGDNGRLSRPKGTIYNACSANIIPDDVKQKIRNQINNPDSEDLTKSNTQSDFFIQKNKIKIQRMRGSRTMKFMNVIKKFGNKNDMLEFRNQLLDEAETLLDDGKMEEYQAKMEDVNTFDAEYAQYIDEKANIEALKGAASVKNVLATGNGMENIVNFMGNAATGMDNDRAYRTAFMNFVLAGEKIPQEFRNADAYTTTSDVQAVIPNTILDRIIERIETTGKLLSKVTRTFYKGGITVPTSTAKPVATWTGERGTTPKQKKTTGEVTFNYYKLKCVVAVSLTVDTVTLEVFERTVASNIAEAMVKALENSIVAGTGTGMPKGILKETAPEGQNIDIASGKNITYKDLCNAEGMLPSAYEGAEWAMTKKTYFGEIVGMTDTNGQPVARTTVGIDGKPSYNILGRPVNFVSSDDMADFASAPSADTVVAFMFRFEDYLLNTNMDITVKHFEDDDTDDKMTKAIMLADGKAVDVNSFVTVTQKAKA